MARDTNNRFRPAATIFNQSKYSLPHRHIGQNGRMGFISYDALATKLLITGYLGREPGQAIDGQQNHRHAKSHRQAETELQGSQKNSYRCAAYKTTNSYCILHLHTPLLKLSASMMPFLKNKLATD